MSTISTPDSERQALLRKDVVEAQVYPVIQMIRRDIMDYIDTPLGFEVLNLPDVTYTIVRPLEEKYGYIRRQGNLSVVFCFLINRAYFLRDRNLATASLSRSRAELCQLIASRILKQHAGDMMELAIVLTTNWSVFAGAPPRLVEQICQERPDLPDRVGNAIEMAIFSQSKRFIKSSACQKVINAIWSGKIVYQAESTRSILSDTYKRTPIHIYDPHKAPLLDHYRLKVPAVRSVLEYWNFVLLIALFVLALEFSEPDRIVVYEVIFMVYALGFTLEKGAAMQEHGVKLYFKGTWNGFDMAFITLFVTYSLLRIWGVYGDKPRLSSTGIDVLAITATLMFPRLVFVTLRNNIMILSLRAMIIQFVVLMTIAAICFCGFWYTLWTLSRNSGPEHSPKTVAWWMFGLMFGSDDTAFKRASDFHPFFGPIVMMLYVCLSTTLLLTILVSILSHTFATIIDDAMAEAMFRRAVSTVEGVKVDYLFSYQPPVNLAALCVMLPLSYILSPRWYHKVNVFTIRITSFPILLFIALYERQASRTGAVTLGETVVAMSEKVVDFFPQALKRFGWFEGLISKPHSDIEKVFQVEDQLEEETALDIREWETEPTTRGEQPPPSIPQSPSFPSPRTLQSVESLKTGDTRRSFTSSTEPPTHASNGPLQQGVAPFPTLHGEAQYIGPLTSQRGPPVKYGPLRSRQRLSSIPRPQHRPESITTTHPTGQQVPEQPIPPKPTSRRAPVSANIKTNLDIAAAQPVSESPEEIQGQVPSAQPVPIGESADQNTLILAKLERMENNQKRLEENQRRIEERERRLEDGEKRIERNQRRIEETWRRVEDLLKGLSYKFERSTTGIE